MIPTLQLDPERISTFASGDRILRLVNLVLFADAYCVLRRHHGLFSGDWEWMKLEFDLAWIIEVLIAFFFFSTLVRLAVLVAGLPLYLTIAPWKRSGAVAKISLERLLNYSLVEDNSTAYNEYLRQSSRQQEVGSTLGHLAVFLCATACAWWAGTVSSQSLAIEALTTLAALPTWAQTGVLGLCAVLLLMSLAAIVFASLAIDGTIKASPRLIQLVGSRHRRVEEKTPKEHPWDQLCEQVLADIETRNAP